MRWTGVLTCCFWRSVREAPRAGGSTSTSPNRSEHYETVAVDLKECSHIPKEKIEQTIAIFGLDHPHTRSTIFGEFQETDDGATPIFSELDIQSNLDANIENLMGPIVAGCDFAAGTDSNVIVRRCGNHVPSGSIITWKDVDTVRAAAMFSHHFDQLRLEPGEAFGDSGGLGTTFCDLLARHWKINRVNACEKSPDPRYANLGAYLWFETARKVRLHQIKLPKNEVLIKQLKSRHVKFDPSGKLAVEDKKEMKARGLSSPDVADAFCLAFGVQPLEQVSWLRGGSDSRYQEISRQHGWLYSGSDDEEESSGRPGRGDDGGSSFDYLNSH
jgi:phage terminase large subunit